MSPLCWLYSSTPHYTPTFGRGGPTVPQPMQTTSASKSSTLPSNQHSDSEGLFARGIPLPTGPSDPTTSYPRIDPEN
jgi:hypothetical protein